nr:hypothetical protein [uncultured bacterium]
MNFLKDSYHYILLALRRLTICISFVPVLTYNKNSLKYVN